jgi:alcohol dehydrogenase
MGAARVVAAGRNRQTLEDLGRRFGPRVRPVPMSGVEAEDRGRIIEAADGPIDLVLDFLPREAGAAQAQAAILAVGHGGCVVLMGGVRGDLALNYNELMHREITIRGAWMYPKEAIPRMIGMIRSGLIDLSHFEVSEFTLDEANEAVAHAAANAGPRRLTVIRPDLRR